MTEPNPHAWTVNSFLEQYPEFRYAGPMIQRALNDAVHHVSPAHFGNTTHEVIGLTAAIALAGSPYAQTQKQDPQSTENKNALTTYEKRLAQIKLEHRIGMIVI